MDELNGLTNGNMNNDASDYTAESIKVLGGLGALYVNALQCTSVRPDRWGCIISFMK